MTDDRSRDAVRGGRRALPGRRQLPVRAMRSVGREARCSVRGGRGDRHRRRWQPYIDLVGSWGPMIVGHAHPAVVAAVHDGGPRLVVRRADPGRERSRDAREARLPAIERMRFVSSGTEASMSAIRLARSHRPREGAEVRRLLPRPRRPLLPRPAPASPRSASPSSPGVPRRHCRHHRVPYNDYDALDRAFAAHGADLACAIVEGVPGNMGVVAAGRGFLERSRSGAARPARASWSTTSESGFRVAPGGAVELYWLHPDLIVSARSSAAACRRRRSGAGATMELLAPIGSTLPGRHAVRQPAGDGGRLRDARPAAGPGR